MLVHNTSGNRQTTWNSFSPLLSNAGYCVFAPTVGALPGPWPVAAIGAMGPVVPSSHQLGAFVDEVLALTGAEKVDLIGHSQGTLIAAYWIRSSSGADKVDRVVSLAPLWKGSDVVSGEGIARDVQFLACPACIDMMPGSDFLKSFEASGMFVDSVEYTNILTATDTTVKPYTSGYAEAPNVTNIILQEVCPSAETSHLGMLADRLTASLMLSVLDENVPAPTDCID
ncbi:alpha/beta fold hydrolase [Rhodococcus pyridinivorans]|nr:alpha/beta fold hydrolase [Rhodococcus pyridinivorans]